MNAANQDGDQSVCSCPELNLVLTIPSKANNGSDSQVDEEFDNRQPEGEQIDDRQPEDQDIQNSNDHDDFDVGGRTCLLYGSL